MTREELIGDLQEIVSRYGWESNEGARRVYAKLPIILGALRPPAGYRLVPEEPTEQQVIAGAVILATTGLIELPTGLSHREWMGLSRHVIEAALAAAPKIDIPQLKKPGFPEQALDVPSGEEG